MIAWTDEHLAAATGGFWTAPLPAGEGVARIVTDSRQRCEQALFLALRGERFDGHAYLANAIAAGAVAVCIENRPEARQAAVAAGVPALIVADALQAYQDLGSWRRRQCADLTVVAVTGSSGKTSTKEIIGAVLAAAAPGAVLLTAGNTNNQIGVPQNLLRLDGNHRYAVIEMGTNASGEIARLTAIAEPDLAVITSVGPVHLEGLGDLAGVAAEKASIFGSLRPNGTAILPRQLLRLPQVSEALRGHRTLTYGDDADADVMTTYAGGDLITSALHLRRSRRSDVLQTDWRLAGRHQALNAGAAVAVADCLGISDAVLLAGLQACHLPQMRTAISVIDGVRWVNDAYNANPDSMRALIDWLSEALAPAQRSATFLVLGDMLELGPTAPQLHHDLVTHAARCLPQVTLVLVGTLMCATGTTAPGFADAEAARRWLHPRLRDGATVVLKGSRGMALERLLPSGAPKTADPADC